MNLTRFAPSSMATSPHSATVCVEPSATYSRFAGPLSVSSRTTMFTSSSEPAAAISARSARAEASRSLSPSM